MKTATRNTLAGMLTCVCLTGMSESAMAQFFNSNVNGSLDSEIQSNRRQDYRPTSTRYNNNRRPLPQRQGQTFLDQNFIRTNTTKGTLPHDDRQSRQGRCPDGQCRLNGGRPMSDDGTAAYRNRDDMASRRDYRSRRPMTTGFSSSNAVDVDFVTGLPLSNSGRATHRGPCRDCANGQCNCPDGLCDCGNGQCNCGNGQCNCANGQCSCANGQCNLHTGQRSPRTAPPRYDDYTLTRRNSGRQYLPTSSPYLN